MSIFPSNSLQEHFEEHKKDNARYAAEGTDCEGVRVYWHAFGADVGHYKVTAEKGAESRGYGKKNLADAELFYHKYKNNCSRNYQKNKQKIHNITV